MKPTRFSFRVVIEQAFPNENRNFGTKEGWAVILQKRLEQSFTLANIVEVKPIRNKKGSK